VVKKVNKQEAENKAVKNIIIQGCLQAAVICVFILLMFGNGNATIVAILDAIKQSKVEAWQIAAIAFPIMFVACTIVQLMTYILNTNKK
jgi:hypothetical protein